MRLPLQCASQAALPLRDVSDVTSSAGSTNEKSWRHQASFIGKLGGGGSQLYMCHGVAAHSAAALQYIRMPVARSKGPVTLPLAAAVAGSQATWNPAACLPSGQVYVTTVAPLPPTPSIESRKPMGLPYLSGIDVSPLGKACFASGSPCPGMICEWSGEGGKTQAWPARYCAHAVEGGHA